MENENTMVTEPAAKAETQETELAEASFTGTDTPTPAEPSGADVSETEGGTGVKADEDPSARASMPPEEAPNEESAANAANAERRRRAEERQREAELSRVREEVRRETILDTLGSVNPYTHEPMNDDTDVREYLEMREIEKRGGDPVAEYAKYHKLIERERADEQKKATDARQRRQRAAQEREEFVSRYPDVKLGELLKDTAFLKYARGQDRTAPLSEIYEGYRGEQAAETQRIEARARELAAQMVANANASPGSAVGAPQPQNGHFTREQVKAMSQREVHENYDKIQESMNYWK